MYANSENNDYQYKINGIDKITTIWHSSFHHRHNSFNLYFLMV